MRQCAMLILVAIIACMPISASSQISVSAEFSNVTYLRFETMSISVTIRNDTAGALVLGGPEDGAPSLDFEVKKDGRSLPRVTKGKTGEDVLLLMPGKIA